MKIILKSFEEVLGYAKTEDARTDPPMGCGEVLFHPAQAYSRVEGLFREKTSAGVLGTRDEPKLDAVAAALSEFALSLATDDGEPLSVVGFTVSDYRPELPDLGLLLEFYGLHPPQFNRLFPGHYQAYESSLKADQPPAANAKKRCC